MFIVYLFLILGLWLLFLVGVIWFLGISPAVTVHGGIKKTEFKNTLRFPTHAWQDF